MKMLLSAAATAGTTADSDARSLLLRRSLRAYCGSSRQPLITETEALADAKTPVTVLESLSAFAPPKHAPLVLFDGLVNAPEAHLGRNVLVCMGTLQAELQSFAERNGVDTKAAPLWWKNILRNYERIILLDNHALAQSAGFAPWAKLHLADNFPVELGPKRDAKRILILNHDPDAGEAVLSLHDALAQLGEVSVLGPHSVMTEDLEHMLEAAVHVHYGYSTHRAATALTPIDSLINGFYTIVMAAPQPTEPLIKEKTAAEAFTIPAKAKVLQKSSLSKKSSLPEKTKSSEKTKAGLQEVPTAVLHEIRNRRYGLVVEDSSELLEGVERFLARLAMFDRDKMAINPELQRYDRMNEEYIAAMHSHFTAQVPA
ncbi:MAG: hypothetical protein U1A24_21635 [Cypionkella sp.]|uniref:hypothetical protein n=1 Tax=Cypionkella sp. TaxID=2811411 RepID=UPI002ABC4965|nr:hypothetical protein [Cypionkella sp.]MDZ4313153.1 hypothetical protein [Cypionkella sp.]